MKRRALEPAPGDSLTGAPQEEEMKSMSKQQASAAFRVVFGLLATSASGQTDVKVVQIPGEISVTTLP